MKRLVRPYVIAAAAIALIGGALPGASIALALLEIVMIYRIARYHGQRLRLSEISQIGGYIFSAGGVLQTVAFEAATLLPFVGWWIIKPTIAVSAVIAFAKAADYYFSRDQDDARPAQAEIEDTQREAQPAS